MGIILLKYGEETGEIDLEDEDQSQDCFQLTELQHRGPVTGPHMWMSSVMVTSLLGLQHHLID